MTAAPLSIGETDGMRVGICAYWFNRGQGVVARQLRGALAELGHETFVLARPTRKSNIRPDWIDQEGPWAQENVTAGSDYLIPAAEYGAWAERTGVGAVFFDQNYQLPEIAELRSRGIRTIGRFVWEHFSEQHVEPARRAFDTIYSLTGAEQERYAAMGIESPRVHWGIAPELLELAGDRPERREGPVTYLFPGGFMSKRKPVEATIEAFRATTNPDLRLLLKAQVDRRSKQVGRLVRGGRRFGRADPRIDLITEDLPTDEYLRLFASADVCLAPSRWEGLGLHLYEATAFAVPIITNDNPPMNEIVADGVNGLLVPGTRSELVPRSGIAGHEPDVPALTAAIERAADPDLRARLSAGGRARRSELAWERTVSEIGELLAGKP